MPEYDPVTKISIVPRGNAGGLTFFAPSEERLESGLYSRSYLENQMSVAMGGRVAEELIFGEDDVTTGASGDFMQVGKQGVQEHARLRHLLFCSVRLLHPVDTCVLRSSFGRGAHSAEANVTGQMQVGGAWALLLWS